MANLWQISLAKLVSDPDAIIVVFISLPDLKISYAPNADLFSEVYLILTGLIACLVRAITLGEFSLSRAFCQHSNVSIEASETHYWKKYTGAKGLNFGINDFGRSAPYKEIYNHFGLDTDNIVKKIKKELWKLKLE